MKIIKGLFLFIVILAMLFFIITLLLPSKYEIEREIEIKAPKTLVYYLIDDLHNWKFWDYWYTLDTNQKRKYIGPIWGKNSSFQWESKFQNVGKGIVKILEDNYFNKIHSKLIFGREMLANSDFTIEETAKGTIVRWKLYGSLPFVAKWFRFFLDRTAGEDLRQGLINLKKIAEKNILEKVQSFVDEIPTIYYIGIIDSSSMNPSELTEKFSSTFQEIKNFITKKGLKHTASAMTITIAHNFNTHKFIVAIPVEDFQNLNTEGSIILDSIPSSKVVRSVYVGSHDYIKEAYDKTFQFMQSMNLRPKGNFFELYVTDPTMVKPNENVTIIYSPI
ncbi:MAG: SRPBCC family protein [Candidatus Kapaibacteriales bacterium]